MMLVTNKETKSKEDVIQVAKTYFSRWRIEEYFRCKKQMFHFENFLVQKLEAINALNFYLTLRMTFLAHLSMKPKTNAVKVSIIQKADPVKKKYIFAITGWQKASAAYFRMQKRVSDSGSRQNVQHTISSASS